MRRNRGFTLIELMIVVAMIGILSSIALPSYLGYVQRGNIPEATNDLSIMRVQLEQYYQDTKDYGSTAALCGNNIGIKSGTNFDFTCTWGPSADNQHFLITATGKNSMSGFVFTIDQANARKTTASPGVAETQDCWIKAAGGSC